MLLANFDGVLEVVAGDDGDHGAKDFLLRDAHLGIDVDEDGGLEEPSMLVFALVEAVAAGDEFCAFFFADVDVAEVGLKLAFVNGRSHFHRLVEAVADFDFPGAGDELVDELAVDAFLHDDAAGRGAALSGGAEGAPEAAFDGEVEVGVVEHDHGILAAEFERAMFEALGGRRAYDSADRRRAGERDGADDGMLGERRSDFGAEAGDDVDDAFRDAGVGQRLNKVEGGERRVLRGLDHAGVAADYGGQDFPRGDGHGEVPGVIMPQTRRWAGGRPWRICWGVRTARSGRRGGGLSPAL